MPFKHVALVIAGFCAGLLAAQFPRAVADTTAGGTDLANKRFAVSIDEIRQNLVRGDEFSGRYAKTVTLSDGSTREVELTPMVHDGKQVVEFKDTGDYTYMGLNGTTTNGTLMVQIRDLDTMRTLLKQEGWTVL
ncbi:MAG: hypothetical protein GXC76_05340 [Rhodanobacteraceae bacterium]|jgi:hypothetical protein|nr:hypothetical protein [Rhodanobacteraceae bacterium]